MNADKKMNLIKRGLHSISDENRLRTIVENRPLRVYWGVAPVGDLALHHLITVAKLADFLEAGCEVTVLIADIHGCLSRVIAEDRSIYFERGVVAMLRTLGALLHNFKIIRGSSFQLSQRYMKDVFHASAEIPLHAASEAGMSLNPVLLSLKTGNETQPTLASAIYPLMQALDEKYIGADAQFGNYFQKNIFEFADHCAAHLGWSPCVHLLAENTSPPCPVFLEDSKTVLRDKLINCSEDWVLEFCRTVLYASGEIVKTKTKKMQTFEDLRRHIGLRGYFDVRGSIENAVGRILHRVCSEMNRPAERAC